MKAIRNEPIFTERCPVMNKKFVIASCMIAAISLTGCGTKVFETELEIYCPPIVQYNADFNRRLAAEIESLPSNSTAIVEALADYAYQRELSERCQKVRSNL
jgi:hypothetical protein